MAGRRVRPRRVRPRLLPLRVRRPRHRVLVVEEAAEAQVEQQAQVEQVEQVVVVDAMAESAVGNGRNATDFCALN